MCIFQKLLNISEKFSFIKPVINACDVKSFKYGPCGAHLRENIRNEWIYSNVTSRDEIVLPSFTSTNKENSPTFEDFRSQIDIAKEFSNEDLPFSFAYVEPIVEKCEQGSENGKYFNPQERTELKYLSFTVPSEGQKYFYYWQRQRNMWWRKFSADPGKFSLTEMKTDERGYEFANVQVNFPWGIEIVETIRYYSDKIYELFPKDQLDLLQVKKGRKKMLPHVVESITSLETASLTFFCDSYMEIPSYNSKTTRPVVKFHRKLAPYKTAFIFKTCDDDKTNEELHSLAIYLSQLLKRLGINTLLSTNTLSSKSINDYLSKYDLYGIPYVVVLKDTTLADGLLGLRSRDTTLQEILHVSKLSEHMQLLLKNY